MMNSIGSKITQNYQKYNGLFLFLSRSARTIISRIKRIKRITMNLICSQIKLIKQITTLTCGRGIRRTPRRCS